MTTHRSKEKHLQHPIIGQQREEKSRDQIKVIFKLYQRWLRVRQEIQDGTASNDDITWYANVRTTLGTPNIVLDLTIIERKYFDSLQTNS